MSNTIILRRIKGLLALAQSSNPYEAASAAAKAQDLLARHNLELSQVAEVATPDYEQSFLQTGSRMWRQRLLHAVASTTFCVALYDSEKKCSILIGQPHNIEVVQFLYSYLAEQFESMATNAYRQAQTNIPSVTWKNSFFAGATGSVYARLKEQQQQFQETSQECRSLVVRSDQELRRAVYQLYPNIIKGRAQRLKSRPGYDCGIEAGKTIALRKAVE